MATKVTVKSIKPMYKKAMSRYEDNASRFVDRVGLFFVGSVKRAMQQTPQNITGRSLKGNTPAIDTGLLVNSISYKRISSLEGKVFTNVEYAEYLEMNLDRPFMSKHSVPYINTTRKAQSIAKMIGDV